MPECAYCNPSVDDAWVANELVVAIPHPNPASAFHVVVAPRRHVPGFYDLDVQEQRAIWNVLGELRERIAASTTVEKFMAGFVDVEDGVEPAHTHVHLVPKVAGHNVTLPEGAEWVELT